MTGRIVHNVGVEPELQPAPSDVEKKAGVTHDLKDDGVTSSVSALDGLIAVTREATRAYTVLAIAVGLVAVGLLLGLVVTRQLHLVGAIGSAATAAFSAAPVALIVSERARAATLRAARERALLVSSDPAEQKKVVDAINVLIAILT
jgi:hypothetical protein